MHTENNINTPALTPHQTHQKALNLFFSMYGEETGAYMSKFLFERLADFARIEGLSDDYRADSVLHFTMLHHLVTGLQCPDGLPGGYTQPE